MTREHSRPRLLTVAALFVMFSFLLTPLTGAKAAGRIQPIGSPAANAPDRVAATDSSKWRTYTRTDDATDDAADDSSALVSPGLLSSWPTEDVDLWVPPKEARLTFNTPVLASSLEVEILRHDGAPLSRGEITRLTRGEGVQEILLRLPQISPERYVINWSVTASSGEQLQGAISFELLPPFATVGGQNHRHGDSHIYLDSPGQFLLRVFLIFSLALVLAGLIRARRRGSPKFTDTLLVRAGGVLTGVAGIVAALVDVVSYVIEYHEYPFSAALTAPALSVLLPLLIFSGLTLFSRQPVRPILGWVAAAVAASYAGLSHAVKAAAGLQLFIVFAALLALAAWFWGSLWAAVFPGPSASTPDSVPATHDDGAAAVGEPTLPSSRPSRVLLHAQSLGMLLLAESMVFLHAGSFSVRGDFVSDIRNKLVMFAATSVLLLVLTRVTRRALPARVIAVMLLLLTVAFSAGLLWMPPPTAGL